MCLSSVCEGDFDCLEKPDGFDFLSLPGAGSVLAATCMAPEQLEWASHTLCLW